MISAAAAFDEARHDDDGWIASSDKKTGTAE